MYTVQEPDSHRRVTAILLILVNFKRFTEMASSLTHNVKMYSSGPVGIFISDFQVFFFLSFFLLLHLLFFFFFFCSSF